MASIAVAPDADKSILLALNANDAWRDQAHAVAGDVAAAAPGSVLVVDLEVSLTCVQAAVRAAGAAGFPVVLGSRSSPTVAAGIVASHRPRHARPCRGRGVDGDIRRLHRWCSEAGSWLVEAPLTWRRSTRRAPVTRLPVRWHGRFTWAGRVCMRPWWPWPPQPAPSSGTARSSRTPRPRSWRQCEAASPCGTVDRPHVSFERWAVIGLGGDWPLERAQTFSVSQRVRTGKRPWE